MIIIFSYNRPDPLLKMLKELNTKVTVIDDGSDYDYTEHEKYCTYHRLEHRGKRYWWKNWNYAFELCKESNDDRFMFFMDNWQDIDMGRIDAIFDTFDDCFAFNVVNYGWTKSWTPLEKSEPIDYYYRVGWIDCGFVTTRKVLERLDWKINPIKYLGQHMSSGVGAQISRRLYDMDIPMYEPVKSMIQDQDVPSQMNPQRGFNPIAL